MSTFLVDDPEIAAFGEDLAWPLALDGTGDLATISGPDNLVLAMELRAVTLRGEIPHRPLYGIDFEEFQGAPGDPEEAALLQARLLEQYQRETRLESLTVDVVEDDSGNGDVLVQLHGQAKTGAELATVVPLQGRA